MVVKCAAVTKLREDGSTKLQIIMDLLWSRVNEFESSLYGSPRARRWLAIVLGLARGRRCPELAATRAPEAARLAR